MKNYKTKNMFKQKIYRILFLQPKIKTEHLAERAGCDRGTANYNRVRWNKLTDEEKKAAYKEVCKILNEGKFTPPTQENKPHPMDGFHTPYNFIKRPRSRMWISRY